MLISLEYTFSGGYTKIPVLAVLPTLKAPFTAPQVAAKTGLPTTEARRALEGLTKVRATVKVRGKQGQYRLAKKR